jgi:hypothetical protein
MPVWLIAVIILLIIIVVGCCGGVTTCVWLGKRAASAAASLSPIQTNGSGGFTIRSGGGEFNVGALPSSFPTDIPIYTGMKPIESGMDKNGNGTVTLMGAGSTSDVADWYQDHMKSNGWTLTDSGNANDTQHQAYQKGDRQASVTITPSGNESMVVINVGKGNNPPGPGAAAPGETPAVARAPDEHTAPPAGADARGNGPAPRVMDASGKPLKLPSNFPSDLTVYPGMNSTFSASDNLTGKGSVLLQGKVEHQNLVDYYRKQVKDGGWEQTGDTEVGELTQLTYTKDDREVLVQVSPGDDGMTLLTLNYAKK